MNYDQTYHLPKQILKINTSKLAKFLARFSKKIFYLTILAGIIYSKMVVANQEVKMNFWQDLKF